MPREIVQYTASFLPFRSVVALSQVERFSREALQKETAEIFDNPISLHALFNNKFVSISKETDSLTTLGCADINIRNQATRTLNVFLESLNKLKIRKHSTLQGRDKPYDDLFRLDKLIKDQDIAILIYLGRH